MCICLIETWKARQAHRAALKRAKANEDYNQGFIAGFRYGFNCRSVKCDQ